MAQCKTNPSTVSLFERARSIRLLRLLSVIATFILPVASVVAQDATTLFKEFSSRIYQIRIIDESSGKQAGLGSGFLISADGLIVTNYHVIADYTSRPQRYAVEFVRHNGEKGPLTLINVDVVNDLALLRLAEESVEPLTLSESLPSHGESIYSIGNPHDLGWTVVPGTYNGITAHSLYERIHFSGSVNPGMSGGPVLNATGEVIGVNVATAGNQLSFLVPLNRLRNFLANSTDQEMDISVIDRVIADQLIGNQSETLQPLLEQSWDSTEFGQAYVPSEIAPYIRCWGLSDDDPEILYSHSATVCNSEEQIYVTSDFNTGNIAYQFNWLETEQINMFRFYNMYKDKISNAYPDNDAGKEDVTEFECHEDFITSLSRDGSAVVTKAAFCAREYKKYRGLFDVLYFGATVHRNRQALVSHFTMAGVDRELGLKFLEKFLTTTQWK